MNRDDVFAELKNLSFDTKEYWVTSGAALVIYGIKAETKDIDLGCTSRLADELQHVGYYTEVLINGTRRIQLSDSVEIFENWIEDNVVTIDGIPVVSVEGIILMKEKLGRDKDLRDICLIKEWLNKCNETPLRF